MPRPATRLLVLLLASSVLLVPAATGAQEQEPDLIEPFPNVFVEVLDDGRRSVDGGLLQPYLFSFAPPQTGAPELGASVPEQQGTRSFIGSRYPLVIQVLRGEFAFAATGEDVALVDPRGEPIPILVEVPGDPIPTYDPTVPTEFVQDDAGNDCTTICAVPTDQTVLIEEGATVFLPRGVACLVCSFDTLNAQLRVVALLESGVAPEEFEWITGEGIVTPDAQATPSARRWASPKTSCH